MKRYLFLLVFLAGCSPSDRSKGEFFWLHNGNEAWECLSYGQGVEGDVYLRTPSGLHISVHPDQLATTREGAGDPELVTVPYPRPAAEAVPE